MESGRVKLAVDLYAALDIGEAPQWHLPYGDEGVAADYEVDSSFDKNLVIGLAKNLEGMSYAERCQKIEQMGSTLYESYKLFGVADKTGKVHTSHTDDYYIGDRDFFRTLRDGQDDVISSDSNNYTPDGRCKVLYTLAKLKDAAGNFDGAVFLAEEANKDLDILDLTFFEKEVPAFLVRPDGQVVSYRGQDFNTDNLLKFLKEYSPDCKNAVEKIKKDYGLPSPGGCKGVLFNLHLYKFMYPFFIAGYIFNIKNLYLNFDNSKHDTTNFKYINLHILMYNWVRDYFKEN